MKENKFRYEYWPWWLFFLPLLPVWLLHAIRLKHWFYFTNVNPTIELGGFFGESKSDILNHVSEKYKVKSHLIQSGDSFDPETNGFKYPIICKPNVGERGYRVEVIENKDAFQRYLSEIKEPVIVQEYIDWDLEFGILFVKMPGDKHGKVTSLTKKKFMSVVGDGVCTIKELMLSHPRHWRYADQGSDLILEKGEEYIIQPIGNHCLGTEFINGSHLINDPLHQNISRVVEEFKDLHYGRLDLKVKSIEDLYTGEHLRIFEINGVSGEPGHIYDYRYSMFQAYRDVIEHWKFIYRISKKNLELGVRPDSFKTVARQVIEHFKTKKPDQ